MKRPYDLLIFFLIILVFFCVCANANEEASDKRIEEYLSAIKQDPYDEISYLDLAEIYLEKGDEEEAISILKKGISKIQYPYRLNTWLYIIYKDKNDFSNALVHSLKSLEVLPHYKTYLDEYEYKDMMKGYLIDAAECYEELEKWEEAIEYYNQVFDVEPDHPGVYADIGYCLEKMNKEPEAIKIYEKAVSLSQVSSVQKRRAEKAYFRLARIYSEQGKLTEAIELYKNGIKADPWKVEEKMNLADLLESTQRYDEAHYWYSEVYEQSVGKDQTGLKLRAKNKMKKLSKYVPKEISEVDLNTIPIRDRNIYILPIGDYDKELMKKVCEHLQNEFRIRMVLLEGIPVPTEAHSEERGQYMVKILTDKLKYIYNNIEDNKKIGLLAIFSRDITDKDTNYLFAYSPRPVSVMSYYRFTAEFNQEDENSETLLTRILSQAYSCMGHLLDMPRCTYPPCARIYVHSFEEFLNKKPILCKHCKKLLKQILLKYSVTTDATTVK